MEDNYWWTGDPGIEHLYSEDGRDAKGRTVVAVNAIRMPFRRRDQAFRFLRYQLYPTVSQGKYVLIIYGSCSSTSIDNKVPEEEDDDDGEEGEEEGSGKSITKRWIFPHLIYISTLFSIHPIMHAMMIQTPQINVRK